MNYLKLVISAVSSLGGSIASFIASAKSTYILLAILGIGGWYMWNDYQSLREDNGKLSLALEVASSGTKEALNVAEQNASQTKAIAKHYQEILNELQRVAEANRVFEESLSNKEREIIGYRNNLSQEDKRCMELVLSAGIFGNLVHPNNDDGNGLSNN